MGEPARQRAPISVVAGAGHAGAVEQIPALHGELPWNMGQVGSGHRSQIFASLAKVGSGGC